jgi:hypothetical protein
LKLCIYNTSIIYHHSPPIYTNLQKVLLLLPSRAYEPWCGGSKHEGQEITDQVIEENRDSTDT